MKPLFKWFPSMMDQYAKFLIQSKSVPWRNPVSSFNYILTSSGWRQDHNGFSHQNPGFIDDALRRPGEKLPQLRFPPDANSSLAVMEQALSSVNRINVIVAGKTLEPRCQHLLWRAKSYVMELAFGTLPAIAIHKLYWLLPEITWLKRP